MTPNWQHDEGKKTSFFFLHIDQKSLEEYKRKNTTTLTNINQCRPRQKISIPAILNKILPALNRIKGYIDLKYKFTSVNIVYEAIRKCLSFISLFILRSIV